MTTAAIYIGCSPEAARITRDTILSIISSDSDEKTKRLALETLSKVCSVGNTSFSDCRINVNIPEVLKGEDDHSFD